MCVASTCLYDLPTTPGHAPDEVADGLLRDLLPDLHLHLSHLADALIQSDLQIGAFTL